MSSYIGIDIGGTKIYGVSYDDELKKSADFLIPTGSENGQEFVYKNIVHCIEKLKTENTKAIGISWAGFVDAENGIVKHSPNITGFENFPLQAKLEAECGIPVCIENDAHIFAYAEAHSMESSPKTLLGITIGTGIGGGVIQDGVLFRGAHNFSAEIGHIVHGDQEIEQILSGTALQKFWKNTLDEDFDLEKAIEAVSGKKSADFLSHFEYHIDQWGQWLAGLVLAYDPSDIVIGGTIGRKFWSCWETQILIATKKYLSHSPAEFELRFSEFENSAPLGAALYARENIYR